MANRSSSPVKMLVVDDDRTFRLIVQDYLAEAGHDVTSVGDGALALQVLMDQRFALALVDLSMPRIDGLRLIGLVRGDSRHRHMKIVVLSGTQNPADIREALAIGANAFCPKPIRRQELLAIVDEMLGSVAV